MLRFQKTHVYLEVVAAKKTLMNTAITAYIAKLPKLAEAIPRERKVILNEISDFIINKKKLGEKALLNYICTHNSRRSHFGQIWSQVLADAMLLTDVKSYSGGTEATACHSNTLQALQNIGFKISDLDSSNNKKITVSNGAKEQIVWSKTYDNSNNPQQDFCAVLTCTEADEACPLVLGAEKRVACPYIDPKAADGTASEKDAYLHTSQLVATECWYVMNRVSKVLAGDRQN